MEMILFEREIIEYFGLPSIPKKVFDGKTPFDKGVAVVETKWGDLAYAGCAYCPHKGHTQPIITKVFGIEPFVKIKNIFIVPDYMATEDDVDKMDLDESSKQRTKDILKEANALEHNEILRKESVKIPKNEYFFDNIKTDEEAAAFIQAYNKRNKIKGRVPTTHEGLVLRLAVIYSDGGKITKKKN